LNYRQKCEIRDLVDLGDGYDETDTFIDNTEAVSIVLMCTTVSHCLIVHFQYCGYDHKPVSLLFT